MIRTGDESRIDALRVPATRWIRFRERRRAGSGHQDRSGTANIPAGARQQELRAGQWAFSAANYGSAVVLGGRPVGFASRLLLRGAPTGLGLDGRRRRPVFRPRSRAGPQAARLVHSTRPDAARRHPRLSLPRERHPASTPARFRGPEKRGSCGRRCVAAAGLLPGQLSIPRPFKRVMLVDRRH